MMLKTILTVTVLLSSKLLMYAQEPIEAVWYNEEKTARIEVFKARDNKIYGKIVWLKEPLKNGKPKVDENNPDATKRSHPILGLVILKGLEKTDDNVYENGTIYDPKNGKTYSCIIRQKGNKLSVRGYIGVSLIGRTTTWTKD